MKRQPSDVGSALVNACDRGDLEEVKKLVFAKVPLSMQCEFGSFGIRSRPLRRACYNGHIEVVEFLLNNGADPNVDNVLYMVCSCSGNNRLFIVQLLLKHGADVNSRENNMGITPLTAVSIGKDPQPALLELLIQNGADTNLVDNGGYTALFRTVQHSRPETAIWLLENGSDVSCDEQQLLRMIVEHTFYQDDTSRMIKLLRIIWQKGIREINDDEVRYMVTLPPWSSTTHWIYSFTFKRQVKTILMLWNRKRSQYPTLAKEIALIIIQMLASYETKTVYHHNGQQ